MGIEALILGAVLRESVRAGQRAPMPEIEIPDLSDVQEPAFDAAAAARSASEARRRRRPRRALRIEPTPSTIGLQAETGSGLAIQ